MSNHMPFALDDDQLDAIMRHAAPLQPDDRRPFVEAVTRALQDVEPGPGAIQRACAAAQRVFPRSRHGRQDWRRAETFVSVEVAVGGPRARVVCEA